jgi:uncharacterized protein YbjT (DUF2867 family)
MTGRILVIGATGRVGSLVVRELAAAGHAVAGLARDPVKAAASLPAGVPAVAGDLADEDSVAAAMQGVSAVFVASPIHPRMADWQCAAVRAAAQAGVRRIVKLSGSAWTLRPGEETTVGAAHASVEAEVRSRAAQAAIEHCCVRPNAFLQGMLARVPAEVAAGDSFSLAIGDASVAFADVRDIASACATALSTPSALPAQVEVSGPRAVGGAGLAAILQGLLGRPVAYRAISVDAAVARARAAGATEFVLAHQREVLALLHAGAGSAVSPDFEALCGRAARAPDAFLAESVR